MRAARKLTKVGNSYAAIIPRKILDMLDMDGETPIEFATDGQTLIIRPIRQSRKKAKVARAIDAVFTRYRKTMLTLSGSVMPRVVFLDLDDVLAIHARALADAGGADGVLKQSGLESAIAAPRATYGGRYLNGFPFEMAAAYLIGFTLNHAFIDGNKRVAAGAAAVFLAINGYDFRIDPDAFSDLVLRVAAGEIKKQAVAKVLEEASARARR